MVRGGHPQCVGSNPNPGRLLVVFDGHCGLCNRTVRWLLARDTEDRLRFVASEEPLAVELLRGHGADLDGGAGSIVVMRYPASSGEQPLVRSNAIVALLGVLPSPWPAFGAVLRLVPRAIRDLGYRLIARWRYRIWGRLAACPLPMSADREKFI